MTDPVVANHVVHTIHHLPAMKPVIIQGYTFMEMLITNGVTALVAGGLAWYVRGRGITGVEIDISNIKNDIENLKAKVQPIVLTSPGSVTRVPAPAPVIVPVNSPAA